jgi:hypothetical protein
MLSVGDCVVLLIVVPFSLFAGTVTAANVIVVKDAGSKGGVNKDVKQTIVINVRSRVDLDTSCVSKLIAKGALMLP